MTTRSSRRPSGYWVMRDQPGIFWMVAAVVTAAVHPFAPGSTWLMVHMIALGVLTHSIMVWSTHFATTLLKTGPRVEGRGPQNRRLILLHVGITAVLVGVPTTWWWLTTAGAGLVVVAVVWHAVSLYRRLRTALPGRFRIVTHYYLTSAAFLPVGAVLGVLLARGYPDGIHSRLLLGHSLVNVLGWVGITVAGTVITLWPTILRARMDDASERRAGQALPALAGGLLVALAGALLAWRWLLVAGLVGYLLGLLWTGRSLLAPARKKPPMHFASWSMAAGGLWFLIGILMVTWRVATAPDLGSAVIGYGSVAAVLVLGFGLQVLLGALSHMIPAVIGGGPSASRVGIEGFDRLGMTRIVIVNVPFALSLLPLPSATRSALLVLVLIGFAAYLPILLDTIRRIIRAQRAATEAQQRGERPSLAAGRAESARVLDPPFPHAGLMAGVTLVALALAAGPAIQPTLDAGGRQTSSAADAAPTGETTRVDVTANADMSYSPSTIKVPAGNRLVITLTNSDGSTVHDLHFDDEHETERLTKGESATLDLGVVDRDREGWCTVAGHRAMGMVLDVEVTGARGGTTATDGEGGHAGHHGGDAPLRGSSVAPQDDAFALDPSKDWPKGYEARDARLPELTDERTHRVTLRVQDKEVEVAPGVTQTRWTFGDTAPGPVLHGRVGDKFIVTLVNDGSIGHSIDFHAGALAPDRPMRTIAPGKKLTYTFTAEKAGIWMYHCATMPMATHIAKGMHGAVIIEPPDLPEVDRSYVLTASELYAGEGTDGSPAATTFNGRAFQYDADPLSARVGERVRFWVLDAGPDVPLAFHIIGTQFDTVWKEGAYELGGPDRVGGGDTGSQALGLLPAQGGFVETTFPEAGHYPVVNHLMTAGEKGAHGIVRVRR